MKIKKHWYHSITYCCPMCGCIRTHKERKYTPKPPAAIKRHEYHDCYCGCVGY